MDNDIKLSELYALVAQRLNITNSEAKLLVNNAIANIETPKNTLENAFRKAKSDLAIDIPHIGVNTYGMSLAELDEQTKSILQDGGFDSLATFNKQYEKALHSFTEPEFATVERFGEKPQEIRINQPCTIGPVTLGGESLGK